PAPPLLAHPSQGRGSRHPNRPGTPRSHQPCHHAALHARVAGPAVRGLPPEPPESLMPGAKEGGGKEPEGQDRLADLWRRFKEETSQDARDQLILQFAPLVKYVASRVATGLPATVEQADLVSYGMFGLIDALEKFDPARGNKFETYAIPRIKGAIIDELRAMDWVPRSVRFKAREIE